MVDVWGEVMGSAGRAGRSRDEKMSDGRARAYLLLKERRVVVEAASSIGT